MEDIKQAINDLGHEVTNIWNVKHQTTKKPLPLFFIELKQRTTRRFIRLTLSFGVIFTSKPLVRKEQSHNALIASVTDIQKVSVIENQDA